MDTGYTQSTGKCNGCRRKQIGRVLVTFCFTLLEGVDFVTRTSIVIPVLRAGDGCEQCAGRPGDVIDIVAMTQSSTVSDRSIDWCEYG